MSHLQLTELLNNLSDEETRKHYSRRADRLYLLEKFCDEHSVTKKTNEGILPLQVVMRIATQPQIIDIFLKNGANVKELSCGFTPLQIAAGRGLPRIVNHLLKNGADPDRVFTPHKERHMCEITACQMSLVSITDGNEIGPDDFRYKQHLECCNILIDVTDNLNHPGPPNGRGPILKDAVTLNDVSLVRKLLSKGAKVPNDDFQFVGPYEPVMHRSVSNSVDTLKNRGDALEILKLLLEHGGNPSECLSSPRRYLLDTAGNDQEIVNILKKYGAKNFSDIFPPKNKITPASGPGTRNSDNSAVKKDVVKKRPVKQTKKTMPDETKTKNSDLLQSFPNVGLLIDYSDAVKTAWEAVQVLPSDFEKQFLSKLDANPNLHPDILALEIYNDFLKLRPSMDTEESKKAAKFARSISLEAEDEFAKVYSISNPIIPIEEITKKISLKFGKSDNAREQAFNFFQKCKDTHETYEKNQELPSSKPIKVDNEKREALDLVSLLGEEKINQIKNSSDLQDIFKLGVVRLNKFKSLTVLTEAFGAIDIKLSPIKKPFQPNKTANAKEFILENPKTEKFLVLRGLGRLIETSESLFENS